MEISEIERSPFPPEFWEGRNRHGMTCYVNPEHVVAVQVDQRPDDTGSLSACKIWVNCTNGEEYEVPLPPRFTIPEALALLGIKSVRNYLPDDDS